MFYIPKHLNNEGYETAAFIGTRLLSREFGFSRGFEIYDDDFSRLPSWSQTLLGRLVSKSAMSERKATQTVDQFEMWHRSRSGQRPYFAWVQFFDAYGSDSSSSPSVGASLRKNTSDTAKPKTAEI